MKISPNKVYKSIFKIEYYKHSPLIDNDQIIYKDLKVSSINKNKLISFNTFKLNNKDPNLKDSTIDADNMYLTDQYNKELTNDINTNNINNQLIFD